MLRSAVTRSSTVKRSPPARPRVPPVYRPPNESARKIQLHAGRAAPPVYRLQSPAPPRVPPVFRQSVVQATRAVIVPPAYRPQLTQTSLQPKPASLTLRPPVLPAPYRPVPPAKASQPTTATTFPPGATVDRDRSSAPTPATVAAMNRAQHHLIQPLTQNRRQMSHAPRPFVRPTVAVRKTPPVHRPSDSSIQPYFIIRPEYLFETSAVEGVATARQQREPYAIIGGGTFKGQQLRENNDFLGQDRTKAEIHPAANMSLRVSDDGEMAIEDSDLKNRQPKQFYATAQVITSATKRLTKIDSAVGLKQKERTITVVTAEGEKKLHAVAPTFGTLHPNELPQYCNVLAGKVTGLKGFDSYVGWRAEKVPFALSPGLVATRERRLAEGSTYLDERLRDRISEAYVRSASEQDLE